jgi:hypothetical protein
MHRLSVKLQLSCRERSFDELHLQCRINGAGWRQLHSVCGRQAQGVGGISLVQRLPNKLHLACWEHSFDELHLQRRMDVSSAVLEYQKSSGSRGS